MACRHFIVSGRVQGVFYRASTQRKAQQLNLAGWVRNLPNSNVELVAAGDDALLDRLEEWLWQGPDMAVVTQLDVSDCVDAKDVDMPFGVRY